MPMREALARSLIMAAALIAASLGKTGALAQTPSPPPPGDEVLILNVHSDPARCDLGRALRIALDRLIRDYRALQDRCVAVRGYWRGPALFLHPGDGSREGAYHADTWAANRIGLYGRPEIMESTYARSLFEVTAVGVLGSCETLGDHSVMVMGYCHSNAQGPYLALAEMYLEP